MTTKKSAIINDNRKANNAKRTQTVKVDNAPPENKAPAPPKTSESAPPKKPEAPKKEAPKKVRKVPQEKDIQYHSKRGKPIKNTTVKKRN